MSSPSISIITSMFNSENYIDRFMDNVISQTDFDQSELILIDANKDSEKRFVSNYIKKHQNIKHFHISDFNLTKDPGVYGCWNLGIQNSSGEFITNMNLDDSRSHVALEKQRECLNSNPEIDLVYYRTLETSEPNENFYKNSAKKEFPCFDHCYDFLLKVNSPHCQPMWRRSLHDRFGFFNETLMSAGDYDMWLRAASRGSKMKKIDEVLGLYYRNPDGISSGSKTLSKAIFEVNQIKKQYSKSYI